jgi:hypothetical protein
MKFCFRFFHESSSPKALKITLDHFEILRNLWRYLQVKYTTGINDKHGKFAASVNYTGGKCHQHQQHWR